MNKLIICLFAIICVQNTLATIECKNLQKLSPAETVEVLTLVDQMINPSSDQLKQYKELSGCEFTNQTHIKQTLYHLLENPKSSWYGRLMGFVTFTNFLLVCMTVVAVMLVISCAFDIVILIGVTVYQLFVNRVTLYSLGYMLSFVTLFFRYDDLKDTDLLKSFFLLEQHTSLFGTILFLFVTTIHFQDFKNQQSTEKSA